MPKVQLLESMQCEQIQSANAEKRKTINDNNAYAVNILYRLIDCHIHELIGK